MSKYIARLKALIQEKHLPTEVPKVPKANPPRSSRVVRALGPEHAVTEAGQVFDRLENNQGKSNAAPA